MIDLNRVRARNIHIHTGEQRATPVRVRPPDPRAGIPPDPTEYFAGREPELEELSKRLLLSRRVTLYGLAGIGKTQLAARYVQEHRADYPDGCFWLRGDDVITLLADLASLAWRLHLPERELVEQELAIEAVLRWLQEHGDWMLVVDNLDQPVVEELRYWLPPGLPGRVLITSRSPLGTAPLGIEPLPLAVAERFLIERTEQYDAPAARAVAEILGRLPLALQQAAAYMTASGRDIHSYAELLRTRLTELLHEGKPDDYPFSVATTWGLSLQRVDRDLPGAAAPMHLCAFLAPDDIPIWVVKAAASELPEELQTVLRDEIKFDRAISVLRRYSLIARRGDRLSLHRLVQAVTIDSLSVSDRRSWAALCVGVLTKAFPRDGVETEHNAWPPEEQGLLPHALAAADRAIEEGVALDQCAYLLDLVGIRRFLWRGDYSEARILFERALAIREQVLGPNNPETATSLCRLALVERDEGRFTTARSLFERALTIRESTLGPDHRDTATSLNDLARLLRNQRELAAARPLFERALVIRERVLGLDHPDVASTLNDLARLLYDQGELARARVLCERALSIRERVLGPDHPNTATSLNSLAGMLQRQGEFERARGLYERALSIRERLLGRDHPDTASTVQYMASLLQDQGDLAAAGSLYQRALESRERVLGPDSPYTASSLDSLASLLHAQGDLEAARPLYQRALTIRERLLGANHPDTVTSRENLARLLST